jgi:hypothetical protein
MPKSGVIVPMDCGANAECTAPSAAGNAILDAAVDFANRKEERYVFAYGVEDLRSKGISPQNFARSKAQRLGRLSRPTESVVALITNSIDEARGIKKALAEKGIVPLKIMIFCERWHAMRIRFIWPRVFPGVEIEIWPVRAARGGKDFRNFSLRTRFAWWLANVVGLVAMKVLGMDRVSKIKNP